ncbi:MAG: hypothetical protein KatS3mg016_1700 [Fimbriimonadales bacterium]|nr:MAG: hypothetical protein KatS3mg016_1700 [Fimbriimonadales bacterium]
MSRWCLKQPPTSSTAFLRGTRWADWHMMQPTTSSIWQAATVANATLWRLTLDHSAQSANATPVESLTLKGYPTGRQPTALGFVPARAGDANDDGCVDDADLLQVLFQFGSSDLASDLNRDGTVDDADLLLVLFQFGNGC